MRTIAIIPAVARSTKVPNKNIAPINGYTMLEYSIRAAQAADVDDVIVSTDGDGIAEIGKKTGATILFCPKGLCAERAAAEDIVAHALKRVAADLVLLMSCTAPFHDVIALMRGIVMMKKGEHDSAFLGYLMPQYVWDVSYCARAMTYDHENRMPNCDALPYATECGDYLFTRKFFEQSKKRLGGRIGFVEAHRFSIIGIEDMDDLRIAQAVAKEFDIQPGRLVREPQ